MSVFNSPGSSLLTIVEYLNYLPAMLWPIFVSIQLYAALIAGRAPVTTGNIRPIYEFPNGTWIENLAVRSNGQLLVTLITSPEVYLIDPFNPGSAPKLVAHFSDSLGVTGITEFEDDVFAVARQNLSIDPMSYAAGSSFVSKIDFRNQYEPQTTTIAHFPQAKVLNGMTTAEPGSKFLLVADSVAGVVWRLNTETSHIDCVLNTTATRPTLPFDQAGLGVNGVHTRHGQLYFTNTNRGFYRVPIHPDGTKAGSIVEIASFPAGDDFALGPSGTAYVARGAVDKIEQIAASGAFTALKYNNKNAPELIEGSTAMSFGRTKHDKQTLYVTTNGGLTGLVKGTSIQGGRVLAIGLK